MYTHICICVASGSCLTLLEKEDLMYVGQEIRHRYCDVTHLRAYYSFQDVSFRHYSSPRLCRDFGFSFVIA